MSAAVQVEGVSKRFRVYRERNQSLKAAVLRGRRAKFDEFWALQDVELEIPSGRTFALVGDNGSGKSTLLKCIARILEPDKGKVTVDGTLGALLELGSGFHPELTGRENVYLNASILGLSRRAIDARFDDILDFSGIGQFIDQPVKNYSSGMYVRLGFSVAINVEPDILLVDEVLAVGDASFQRKCLDKFAEYRRDGRTVVVVSHSAATVQAMCDDAAWLSKGRLLSVGPVAEVLREYGDASVQAVQVLPNDVRREGSGEVTIENVEVVGEGGLVAAGAPVRFELSLRSHERIEDLAVGVRVESREGVRLWGANTTDSRVALDPLDGTTVVRFEIPRFPLQGDGFRVLASVTSHDRTHVYDLLRDAVVFDSHAADPAEPGGTLAAFGRWQVLPGAAATVTPFARENGTTATTAPGTTAPGTTAPGTTAPGETASDADDPDHREETTR